MQNMHLHYHANFAIYPKGLREALAAPAFYAKVQTCGAGTDNPRARVHLHNQDAAAVHVHDEAVTWGHLFANPGLTSGDSAVITAARTYKDGETGNRLVFRLNGEFVVDVANRVIGNEDVLLINYGNDGPQELQRR